MNKDNKKRKCFWDSINVENDKTEKNQNQVYYRHNRPFDSMGEQNVLKQSSKHENGIDESKDFIDSLDFLDILENRNLFMAIKKLKKIDYEIIVLRYRFCMSFKDIAHILNISVDTANKRHARTLENLRKSLK